MRWKLLAVPMMLLLLTSCGAEKNPVEDALSFRNAMLEHSGCTFAADIVTEVEDRGYTFSLDAVYEVGGRTELTVTAPETLAGIRAEMTAGDAVLEFEDIALDFGKLDDAMETPLYAPWVLGAGWESAYVDCAGEEGELYHVTYRLGYEDEELIVETWFRDGVPVLAEIYREETLLLSAKIESFNFLP